MTAPNLLPDPEQLRDAWRHHVKPGTVHEIRIPKTRAGGPCQFRSGITLSGYFNDADAFVRHVVGITGADAPGVYWTQNAVSPELLARRANRLGIAEKGQLTSDSDIPRLTRLLIDCDPIRDPYIGATDAERDAAIERRGAIRAYLQDLNWPEPETQAMSGNGGHLVYAIDLPNTPEYVASLKGVLATLDDLFSDGVVKVDTTTFNPSRIVKIPATVSAKGDNVPDRPWRLATATHVETDAVSDAHIFALAGCHENSSPERRSKQFVVTSTRRWKPEDVLEDAGISFRTHQKSYGTVYELDRCLTSSDHTSGACIIELKSGALSYRCLHDRCAGMGWADVRDQLPIPKLARDTGNSPQQHRRVANPSAHCEPEPEGSICRRALPVECLPEELQRLVVEAQSTLGIPADFVAVAGLGVIAAAVGNALEIEIKRGWQERANVWLGIVGNPGTTKSPAIETAARPLSNLQANRRSEWAAAYREWSETPKTERGPAPELEVLEATDVTIEGLAHALENSRGVLTKADELSSWIAGHNRYRGHNASERGEYLKLWAGGNITVVRSTRLPLAIERPVAALIGGLQPARLVTLVGDRPGEFINDGMLDRFLIAWPDASPARWTEDEMNSDTIDGWARLVTSLRKWEPISSNMASGHDVVRLTPDAKTLWQQWHDGNVQSIEAANGPTRGWASKAPRHLLRLSLILHAASNASEPFRDVRLETLEAAIELIEWFREQHGLMLSALQIGHASAPAGLPSRIMRVVSLRPNSWVSRAEMLRLLGNVKTAELTVALEPLIEAGRLERRTVVTASKPREEFTLAVGHSNNSMNVLYQPNEKARATETSIESHNPVLNPNGEHRCKCGNQLTERRPGIWREQCGACTAAVLRKLNPALADEVFGVDG